MMPHKNLSSTDNGLTLLFGKMCQQIPVSQYQIYFKEEEARSQG